MITEEKLKENFARNLANYRKRIGLTQLQLAEKLNYTDKSISKWERGDGLPDIVMLASLAELFGVTTDDMLSDKPAARVSTHRNKIITVILSCGIAWLVATVLFFFFRIINQVVFKSWLLYIYAIPISAIILVVFSNIWWGRLVRFISVSALIWSIPLSIVLSLSQIGGISFIFVIAGVVQFLTVFWFLMKKPKS